MDVRLASLSGPLAPREVAALRGARVDAVVFTGAAALAVGPTGLLATCATLRGAGIGVAGAGGNLASASAPTVVGRPGGRVALLAFATGPAAAAAGPTTPGIRYVPLDGDGLARARVAIAGVRRSADVVVAAVHWVPGRRGPPDAVERAFARALAAVGADLVWTFGATGGAPPEWVGRRVVVHDRGEGAVRGPPSFCVLRAWGGGGGIATVEVIAGEPVA